MGESAGWEGRGGDQRGADSLPREPRDLRRKSRRNLQARLTPVTSDASMGHVRGTQQWQVATLILFFSSGNRGSRDKATCSEAQPGSKSWIWGMNQPL